MSILNKYLDISIYLDNRTPLVLCPCMYYRVVKSSTNYVQYQFIVFKIKMRDRRKTRLNSHVLAVVGSENMYPSLLKTSFSE